MPVSATLATRSASPVDRDFTSNRLIASLGAQEIALLRPHLLRVPLAANQILMTPEDEVEYVYFPEAGTMVLLFTAMQDGRTAQSAIVANFGVIGLIEAAGDGRGLTRAMVALPGTALRIRQSDLRTALRRSLHLRELQACYTEAMLGQVMQNAACNALHTVERRTARWILAACDCMVRSRDTGLIEPVVLPLKQELLSDALGVQRTTVTLAAKRLQQAGVISYVRGRITIIDHGELKHAACECHQRLWQLWRRLLTGVMERPAG